MKTLLTMDSLSKLKIRKAELKAQIEQESNDLKDTVLQIREEIEPSKLLKKAVSGAMGFSRKKTGEDLTSVVNQLPAPLAFVLDLFVKDPKWSLGLKLLAPLVIRFLPSTRRAGKPAPENTAEKPEQTNLYGRLREGVSSLRTRLRRKENEPETFSE